LRPSQALRLVPAAAGVSALRGYKHGAELDVFKVPFSAPSLHGPFVFLENFPDRATAAYRDNRQYSVTANTSLQNCAVTDDRLRYFDMQLNYAKATWPPCVFYLAPWLPQSSGA